MEEADILKDGRISYEEFLQVLSSEHRNTVAKFYDETAHDLADLPDNGNENDGNATEVVLQEHGLLESSESHR